MNDIATGDFVENFFAGKTGKFLEIGAFNGGPEDPNEPFWKLLISGWRGVYCEPDPYSIPILIENTLPYNADIITAAFSSDSGMRSFNSSKSHPYLSSFDPNWHEYVIPNLHPEFSSIPYVSKKIYTPTITASQIFENFGYDFDAISVDIELHEVELYNLVKTIDFSKLPNCKLFVVESNSLPLSQYMIDAGFEDRTFGIRMNQIWIRN